MSKFTLDWIKAAAIRALRTMAQTALTMITLGVAVSEINWLQVASVAAVSGVYSILTSIATKLPEVSTDGELLVDNSGDKLIYQFALNEDPALLEGMKKVTFNVVPANLKVPSQE